MFSMSDEADLLSPRLQSWNSKILGLLSGEGIRAYFCILISKSYLNSPIPFFTNLIPKWRSMSLLNFDTKLIKIGWLRWNWHHQIHQKPWVPNGPHGQIWVKLMVRTSTSLSMSSTAIFSLNLGSGTHWISPMGQNGIPKHVGPVFISL